MTESVFFQDLAVLTVIAGFVACICSRFGWPKVIGYIAAGILMGRYTWGGAFLKDPDSVQTLSQLGVVFLMFGMGLNFSAKDLAKIKRTVLTTAIVDVAVMVWLGYTIGTRLFGWNPVQSFFLGVAICDSATTLLAKVIHEMGWDRRAFTQYVLGTSVCEDIVCVGAIAVATGCATGGGMSLGAFAASLGALALFFVAVIVFGLIIVPRLLHSVGKRKDDEALVLAMLACCFLVSYVAYRFEFSLAIGAFLVGFLGATCRERDRMDRLASPLKSMFSAMFFVTIGMQVDPGALWGAWPQILLVSAVVLVGKTVNVFGGSLLTGLDVKTSVQNALSLAQIGEFAFMTAILYAQLAHGTDTPMFQIAVGVSLLTTLLNPLMIRLSDPLGELVACSMPQRARETLAHYQAWLEKIGASRGSLPYILAKRAVVRLVVYAALIVAVAVLCVILASFDYTRFSSIFETYKRWFFFAFANLFAVSLSPLIVPAVRSLGDEVAALITGEGVAAWQKPVRQLIRFIVHVVMAIAFFLTVAAMDVTVFPNSSGFIWLLLAGVALVGVIGWRFFARAGRRASSQLFEALSAEERREGLTQTLSFSLPEGAIHHLSIVDGSPAIGQTPAKLSIRPKTGATILTVRRDGRAHSNIGADWIFAPGDVLLVLGSDTQVTALKNLLAAHAGK